MWKNLYGSPVDNTGEVCDVMDKNPALASMWKGQVLVHILAEMNDKPKKGVEKVGQPPAIKAKDDEEDKAVEKPNWKEEAKKSGQFDKEDYEFMIEIGQGITMPQKDTNYKVKVSVENNSWTTDKPKEIKGEYVRWSDRCDKVLSWKLPKNPYSLFSVENGQDSENKN